MERTAQLTQIDRQICNYYQKHNASKKNSIFCYQPNKEAIAEFYTTMADNFFHKKMKENENSTRRHQKISKTKSQILSNIHNPVKSYLPKQIPQNSMIQIDRSEEQKMLKTAMFSQVQTSKKAKYAIAKQVVEMIAQDIKTLIIDKQEANFRTKFPNKYFKTSIKFQGNDAKTEKLIKQYNRFLTKYKNSNGDSYNGTLGLLQQTLNQQSTIDAFASDKKFQILAIFKKIYMETKSSDINSNLIKYIKKFQLFDKLDKKLRAGSTFSKKATFLRSNSALPNGAEDRSLAKKMSFKTSAQLQKFEQKGEKHEIKIGNTRSIRSFTKVRANGNISMKKNKLRLKENNQNVKNH